MSKKNENVFDKKAVECSPAKKKKDLYYVHVAIGLAIMAVFWVLPPMEPITPLGMKCVGAFLGMVYLWSAIEALWPSLGDTISDCDLPHVSGGYRFLSARHCCYVSFNNSSHRFPSFLNQIPLFIFLLLIAFHNGNRELT